MSEHYYSAKPTVGHEIHTFEEKLRGQTFIFQTDAGVFSKKGIDFGSRLLIETMEISSGHQVLDVGCGYGPIGLCAAVLAKPGMVTLLDVNERALGLAKENAGRNGIGNVTVMQSDALAGVAGRKFDRILTNPPIRAGKEVVHRIFEQAAEALTPGGQLWVVIQKKQGAPSAFAKLEQLFDGHVAEMSKEKGYRIFRAEKLT
ncbi:class I SAM-dependent methyltransferase [Paenibacillus sp. MBLB4367]|uniref:class I SAM-dependent methyltransferase n=1 Tax=Paenibacillus sp. MBLB4367 TaxID=3384767 RepID=UPI00390839FF